MSTDHDRDETIALIRESALAVANSDDLGRARALRFTLPGIDRQVWTTICEMGWPALRTSEARGGVGLGLGAYCALVEQLGRALTPEPLIGAVLATSFLEGEVLADQLCGTRLTLPVWQGGRDGCEPSANFLGKDGALWGAGLYVPMAAAADAFVAVGAAGAWLVDAGADGVRRDVTQTQDGGHYGHVTFEGAPAIPVQGDVASAFAEATLATSAYLLGVLQAAFDRTVDYLKTRVQFGKLIGSFQALQHRAVDLKLQVELTRASVEEAARRWDEAPGAPASHAAISRAKARASSAAALVTRQAIQLHGGIGYSDEHDIGLFLRKAMVVVPQFGTAELHRARFRALAIEEAVA